jgi:hypothetical protein
MTAGETLAALAAACPPKSLAVCIKNPAARLRLIEDVGKYKPALLRTEKPGTAGLVGRDPHQGASAGSSGAQSD